MTEWTVTINATCGCPEHVFRMSTWDRAEAFSFLAAARQALAVGTINLKATNHAF
jgi:hypothetical protein